MKRIRFPFFRVARRLGVLAAFVLAGSVFAEEKAGDNAVIYPRSATPADAPAVPAKTGGSNLPLLVLAGAAAAAGGFMLWRQRRSPGGIGGREARRLGIAESRSLGNRQYLVVAQYDGKKFLLGVCPGSITLLTPLDGDSPAQED